MVLARLLAKVHTSAERPPSILVWSGGMCGGGYAFAIAEIAEIVNTVLERYAPGGGGLVFNRFAHSAGPALTGRLVVWLSVYV